MAIIHAVWIQPKSETTAEEMQTVLKQAKALSHKIPGLIEVLAGTNRNLNNQGYTYGLLLRFVDEEHLLAYFPHPAHRAVSTELRLLSLDLLNFDMPEE